MKRHSRWSTDYETVTHTELKRFSKKLFYCLLLFHHRGYVRPHFLRAVSMPTWNEEKFLKNFALEVHSIRASLKGMPADYVERSVKTLYLFAVFVGRKGRKV